LGVLCLILVVGCTPIQPMAAPTAAPAAELPLLNDLVESVEPVAEAGDLFSIPYDATPDLTGDRIYFTADGAQGPGVFAASATGEITVLATGAPLVAPRGIALSSDGQTLYVADPEAAAETGQGQLFALAVTGGAPTPLAGAAGSAPVNLEVANQEGADILYFSGIDPSDGTPAVLSLSQDALEHSIVAKGEPLVQPQGLAITSAGVVYVADAQGGDEGLASVVRIEDGAAAIIASGFRTGALAGATLTEDEGALLVSALDSQRDSAQVLVVVLADGTQGIINAVIEANDGSGGVHRAHEGNVLAWADSSDGGSVYKIKPPRSGGN
jgi:DNA-binding beta-propeller fold protein YncE